MPNQIQEFNIAVLKIIIVFMLLSTLGKTVIQKNMFDKLFPCTFP